MNPSQTPSSEVLHPSLQQGLLNHQHGDMETAEGHYRNALLTAPGDPEAMLLLGVLARDRHQSAAAVAWTRQAVLARPQHPAYHLNLGLAYLQANKLDKAQQCIQKAAALHPDSAIAWCHLGDLAVLEHRAGLAKRYYAHAASLDTEPWRHYLVTARRHVAQGRQSDALDILNTALLAFPTNPGLLLAAAIQADAAGHHKRAAELCEAAAPLLPASAELRKTWAVALRHLGDLLKSHLQYEEACRLDPDDADSIHRLGISSFEFGRAEEAARCFRRALELRPNDATLHHDIGRAYAELRRFDDAIPCLRQATTLNPSNPSFWNTLGSVLLLHQPDEAEPCFRTALHHRPDFAEATVNLGICRMHGGDAGGMLDLYQRGLQLNPDLPGARYNLSLAYLRHGRYAEAWELYEARWQFPELRLTQRHASAPLWTGEPLEGQTILLHAEQGFGDTLQFLRYVPLVAARGARVILEVPPELKRLAASLAPSIGCAIVARGEPLPPFTWQCPLMSLPRAFATTVRTIPRDGPYLSASPANIHAAWQAFPDDGLRIGIVWAGNPTHRNDARRAMPLAALEPLARIPGVRLISLQKGPAADDLQACPFSSAILDAGPTLNDFEDTAALMGTLDLILSVDTSCAHLAGALGRKVWILLPFLADWRWLDHGHRSAWYPSAMLFRQTQRGDWTGVIASVEQAIRQGLATAQAHENATQPDADSATPAIPSTGS